ncbi:uncharacterized protein [Drosophila kikkawai]|uniref:Uncharacterized protein n=1 Tax=Drosophila kikkawai TaxID=30033 RepID=A0A6P4JJ29_DROKI|nr:uncharacterized protein LOC108083458 [Drosophila kikkawai]
MDKQQPEADQKQRHRDRVIAEALDKIKVYVENGQEEAFIQIKPPQLTSFQMQAIDKNPLDGQDLMECDGVEASAVDRWNSNEVLELDLIKPEDREHLGKTLTDELTGENYMLLPMDIDILINSDILTTPCVVKEHIEDEQEEKANWHSFQLQPAEGDQHSQEPGSQYCRHEFKVPKLNLNFKLFLASTLEEAK